jgi:hypothetical protein
MKRSFYPASLIMFVASAFCYGQTVIAEATVPFDFHVGQTLMPGGDYVVSESQSLLVVRGAAGKPAAMLLTLPTSRHGKASAPSLQFDRYGNEYFLANIWRSDSQEGRALPKSKREQELARRVTFERTAEVALRTTNHPARDDR